MILLADRLQGCPRAVGMRVASSPGLLPALSHCFLKDMLAVALTAMRTPLRTPLEVWGDLWGDAEPEVKEKAPQRSWASSFL